MTRFISFHRVGLLGALLFVGIGSALHAQTITNSDAANSTLDPPAISYRYFITDLGTLGGANSSVFCCFALAINASGQVVGETLNQR